jgi:FkbM family methyltransferase
LRDNIERNNTLNRIIPVKKLLTNKNANIPLYVTNSGISAALKGGNETVEGITLNTFVEKEGLDRLDFIKLDVEGAESEC